MTIPGYLVTMTAVRVAQLKARLSEYLRRVRQGHEVTVLDWETPIARIVPYGRPGTALQVRRPRPGSPGLHGVRLPPPLRANTDVVALLLEERQGER